MNPTDKLLSSENFFDQNGKLINDDLGVLLEVTEIKHANNLDSITKATNNTQTGWLRKGERWDKQENRFNQKEERIFYLAQKLGYTDSIWPCQIWYDKAILLGISIKDLRLRFDMLNKSWQQGIRWTHTILLGSDRLITSPACNKLILPKVVAANYPATETGLLQYLFYQEYLPNFHESFKLIPVTFINTNKPVGKTRADTGDTIETWLAEDSIAGIKELLVFSNQPFVHYQHKVIKFILQNKKLGGINVETVGMALSLPISPVILLDSIARDLYLFNKIIRLSKNAS